MNALNRDTAEVATWLRAKGYRKVIAYGFSFGAVPTLQLTNAAASPVSRTMLVVPLLRLRDPADWRTCRAPGATDARQAASKRSMFGPPAERTHFASALFTRLQAWRAQPADVVEFGSDDCRPLPSDLPPDFRGQLLMTPGGYRVLQANRRTSCGRS